MDVIDREILALLQADGRITLTDLADRIRLSVSRCQRRVRELERTGVIRGYQAKVDPAALDLGFEVLVFATLSRPEMVGDFDRAIAAIPRSSRPSACSASRTTCCASSPPARPPTSSCTTRASSASP